MLTLWLSDPTAKDAITLTFTFDLDTGKVTASEFAMGAAFLPFHDLVFIEVATGRVSCLDLSPHY